MSQRPSGYARRPDEDYATPEWPVLLLAPFLRGWSVTAVWDPAAGSGKMAATLNAAGFAATATTSDFFAFGAPPEPETGAIVTNPPYGSDRRGALASAFIAHAIRLDVRLVCMLLRVDFDSAKTRAPLFRDCGFWSGKIVLLDRIRWFEGESGPSDNHAWFVWDKAHKGAPWIRYAAKSAAEHPSGVRR
jgi:hypothetical protein